MNGTLPAFSAMELLESTGGKLLRGGIQWECYGISTDTRTLETGNLFVALQGENFDGSDYLTKAIQKGAAGLLIQIDRQSKLATVPENVPALGVSSALQAYGAIASRWRKNFTIPLVAVTGSSGKTTTKEMLAAIVSRTMKTLKTEGNLNNQIGLPLTLLKLRKEHQLAVVEMGTNSPGEIAKLAAIATPDIGLITNIGPAHLEGFGSLQAIAEEKGSLWTMMAGKGTAIINNDDTAVASLALRWEGKRLSFGLNDGADITARNIANAGVEGAHFDLFLDGIAIPVFLAVTGRHNVKNALAAAAAAWALGLSREEIAAGLGDFRPVSGRTEICKLANGAHLIIDTYNANPGSVAEALRNLQELQQRGKAVAILGDMLELGKASEKWHREIGTIVAAGTINSLFLKGELTKSLAEAAIKDGFPADNITFFEKPEEVVSRLRPILKKGDWVLIKGSRKMKMETVAEGIIKFYEH
ncbi:MAG: UDP-N-acetylmuramoyl-tripeptide--D-alanyl-D-alanine ligase [Syntrophales bacterium]